LGVVDFSGFILTHFPELLPPIAGVSHGKNSDPSICSHLRNASRFGLLEFFSELEFDRWRAECGRLGNHRRLGEHRRLGKHRGCLGWRG
jgi:hypothetical protein